jgi:hypothetical protein
MNDLNKGNTLIFNYPDYSTQEIIVDEKQFSTLFWLVKK